MTSLNDRFGAEFGQLKHLEILALTTADIEGEVSNTRLQELETDHPAEITQVLQQLCSKGMLKSDNRRRWSRYRIPNSSHNEVDSSHNVFELEKIAGSITKKKRALPSEIRKTVLDLCTERYLDATLLAKLLNRTKHNLRNRYLSPMVTEGTLELKYPGSPNRPDQAYIAKKIG